MTTTRNQNKSFIHPFLSCGLLAAACLFIPGCKGQKAAPPPTTPVTVDSAAIRPEPLSLKVVGVVEPMETVSIKAQVGGVITQVGFTEGQDVRMGQLLLRIDPRPFQASLDAARAQLARDKAQAANAEIQATRYADLVKKDYVTREQADAARTQAEMFKATVQVDEASVEQARLNLAYTSVTAPISGRTGSLLVKRGNVVKANDAALVVINQMHPIRVNFAIPASQLPLVQKYAGQSKLEVHVKPARNNDGPEIKGELSFLDNAVDPGSGTVDLKAEFSNKEGLLWPGQFMDTELILTVEPNALTVPGTAVVTGQEGTFAYVIGPGNKAEKRPIRVNRVLDNLAVIDEGLKAGEIVVTDGQMRLMPGATVEIKTNPSAKGGRP